MISLTRLNGSVFAVNPDLIERVSSNPDTTLHLVDGSTYIVTETVDEVIDGIREFRAGILAAAFARLRGLGTDAPPATAASDSVPTGGAR